MPVLSKAGESHELTLDTAYAFLRHTLNWPPESIAHLALDKKYGEWQLSGLPLSSKQPRVCVLLSGQPQQIVMDYWQSHPDREAMDFFMHTWNDDKPVSFSCTASDTTDVYNSVRQNLQMPADVTNFIIVQHDRDESLDDVSRVNCKMYGVACAFAMAVLHSALSGVEYDTFIQCQSNSIPGKFRLAMRPHQPRPHKWWMSMSVPIAERFSKWRSHYDNNFFMGDIHAMRIVCLMVDNWQKKIRPLLLETKINSEVAKLIGLGMLKPIRSNKYQLFLPQVDGNNAPPNWRITRVGWLKWFYYSPEMLMQFVVPEHKLRVIPLNAEDIMNNTVPVKYIDTAISKHNTRAFILNLDGCETRLAETRAELARVEEVLGPVERVPGIRMSPGWYGCNLSHLKALKKAIDECPEDVQQVAIFEDDFMWLDWCTNPQEAISNLNIEFDVILLNYTPRAGWKRIDKVSPNLLRLYDTYSAAGYIVHRRFWQTLHDFWLKTVHDRSGDATWHQLQNTHLFYGIAPCPSNQRTTVSTITGKISYCDAQTMLIFPPNPSEVTDLARTMFYSVSMPGHSERLKAAQKAVTQGSFDCVVVVEKSFADSRQLVYEVKDAIDRALSQTVISNLPQGIHVFRKKGTLEKTMWCTVGYYDQKKKLP